MYKSTRYFGLSCACDAPMISNYLADNVCSAISLSLFRKQVENLSLCKSLPTLVFFWGGGGFHAVSPWC